MIELVTDHGIGALRDELKTDEFLHVVSSLRRRIMANREIVKRNSEAPLDENSIRNLVLAATGSEEQADRVAAPTF